MNAFDGCSMDLGDLLLTFDCFLLVCLIVVYFVLDGPVSSIIPSTFIQTSAAGLEALAAVGASLLVMGRRPMCVHIADVEG